MDTNGAGDSFVGAFLAELLQGKDFKDAIKAGIYLSGEVVKRSGCTFPDKITFNQAEEKKKDAETTKKAGFLNFSDIQSIVDMSFWLKFTQKKLDVWKLEAPPLDVQATISMPMNTKVASSLVLDEASLAAEESQG